jgi:signal transduction histidine kinase/ActR/RegA family two-component response regulator
VQVSGTVGDAYSERMPGDGRTTESTSTAGRRPPRPPRRRGVGAPVQRYIVGIVVVFLVAAVGGTLYGWNRARSDARRSASADAAFAARLAANAITADLTALQTNIVQTAAVPRIEEAFAQNSSCTLNASGGQAFSAVHLDVIAADGTVGCTSLPDRNARYDVATWLARLGQQPFLVDRIVDPVTGQPAVVVVAAIGTAGVVAGFGDLATLGTGLAEHFGGPRGMEVLVTTGDGTTALSRSIGDGRWTGTPLAGTPFAEDSGASRRDVDGTQRLYGQATVDGLGWTVYAGADESQVLADTSRSFRRVLAIVLAGVALTLAATWLCHRAIARPLRQLSRRVRAATAGDRAGFAPVAGAREVVALGEDFDHLISTVDRELRERQRAEQQARTSEENYRTLFDGHPHPVWVFDPATRALLEVNDAAVAHYGYTRDEFLRMRADDIPIAVAPDPAAPGAPGRCRHVKRDGSAIDVAVTAHDIRFGGRDARLVLAEDVTDRDRLERQSRQAQRLESIGQLAGGVSLDFNNLLTIVLNYALFIEETATDEAPDDHAARSAAIREDVSRIRHAVEGGSNLTRQLLAFARRDVVEPRVLDLAGLIHDVGALLARSLGHQIELRVGVAPDTWRVTVDPGQIEQVLVNLAVNARDAMPDGGTLAIDADNVEVDAGYAQFHAGTVPGRYLRVRVSDSGVGMSRETLERAFEPFFTTKAPDTGTGLGLATVYGIVRQAGGSVHIYSEPGLGTTVSVLLPATDAPADAVDPPAPDAAAGGAETVLVVEDADDLRGVIERILGEHGYTVLTAGTGREAAEVAEAHAGPIDLLLTDVVLRGAISGREVADTLVARRPDLRVLFMSGHTGSLLQSNGTLGEGDAVLQKPFSAETLLARVRSLVGSGYLAADPPTTRSTRSS